ncbi:MAG: C45 family peptidase [Rhodovibrionaceae bacterium]|nr:C45 family peptidase [Rhodovibrionaceae bacterium]
MRLLFQSVSEPEIGPKWSDLFARHWPAYERWYLSEGIEQRPTYAQCLRQLRQHMPELLPTYERVCEAAGGRDLPARFLSLYRPPAYLTGCSQVVWPGSDPLLIRNYDYAPALCEGVIFLSKWNNRQVLAMADCLWGALDGVNDAGLAVSLTFGGRQVVGDGFGVPLIVRYILEFCETAEDAGRVLARVPSHMAYNVTAVDRRGQFVTAYMAPDRPPRISRTPVAANHQGRIDWHNFARATATLERERFLFFRLQDEEMTAERLIDCFLRPPLYTRAYANGFGTLYTAVYRPRDLSACYLWQRSHLEIGIGRFHETAVEQIFEEAAPA